MRGREREKCNFTINVKVGEADQFGRHDLRNYERSKAMCVRRKANQAVRVREMRRAKIEERAEEDKPCGREIQRATRKRGSAT